MWTVLALVEYLDTNGANAMRLMMALCWCAGIYAMIAQNFSSAESQRRSFRRNIESMRQMHALEAKVLRDIETFREERLRMREQVMAWQIAAVRAVKKAQEDQ